MSACPNESTKPVQKTHDVNHIESQDAFDSHPEFKTPELAVDSKRATPFDSSSSQRKRESLPGWSSSVTSKKPKTNNFELLDDYYETAQHHSEVILHEELVKSEFNNFGDDFDDDDLC